MNKLEKKEDFFSSTVFFMITPKAALLAVFLRIFPKRVVALKNLPFAYH
jgi:hypothetical protein